MVNSYCNFTRAKLTVTLSISRGYSFLPNYLERKEALFETLVKELKEEIENNSSQRYVIKG